MIRARSQDVKFGGGVEMLFERQLSIQTKNFSTNTKNMHNVKQKYVRKVSENNISQKNIESFCLIGDMAYSHNI